AAGLARSVSPQLTGSGTPAFATPAAGIGKTVTVSGLALSGPDATNYMLGSATTITTATVTPAPLAATVTASNKVYDATTAATINCSLTGVLGGDLVTCAAASAVFNTAAVGTGKTVTASGLALGGSGAGNYTLANTF